MDIEFRSLENADLPRLHGWLNDPSVVEWWEGEDVSWPSVQAEYTPPHTDGTEHWIASTDGAEIGWIQCYPVSEAPEEWEQWKPLGICETAAGIDYLIGDGKRRGKGLGSAMIAAFTHTIVFGTHPGWTQACASPFSANHASCGSLARAGYRFVAEFDDPEGSCSLFAIERPESEGSAGPGGTHPGE